jgi:hypothetical protein
VLPRKLFSSDNDAPSRERPLTTLGFPLGLGVQEHFSPEHPLTALGLSLPPGTQEHFSPITRDSQPASGLITLPRADTHAPATFYLLENPSVAGFSGAPVFLFPKPFASNNGAIVMQRVGPGSPTTVLCVGIVHGTMSDETGGKMSAVTPSKYVLETMDKALSPRSGK